MFSVKAKAMSIVTAPLESKLITGEELLAMGDIGPCELIDGRIVRKSYATAEHGFLVVALATELANFVKQRQLGRVMIGGVGVYIRRDPDQVRAMDIAFISEEHWPHKLSTGFLDVVPELVVEVISPDDRWEDMRQKLEDYFSIGVQRVWVVEPENRAVLVYRSITEMQRLSESDVLTGEGLLEGFALPVASLFEE
jgi:Uma2 family endonuclease